MTLLVVSLEVPNTFDELLATMRGFFAFAICFYLLLIVWYDHYKYFRRYGLNDTPDPVAQRGAALYHAHVRLSPEVPLYPA